MLEEQLVSDEAGVLLQPTSFVARMLRFESALAQTQAALNIIPAAAASSISQACADPSLIARFDPSAARLAGNPAIALIRELKDAVRAVDADAAEWTHFGATSQDVIDTATMLTLREVIVLHRRDLRTARDRLAHLAEQYAATPMAARTLLQQAAPITFGFKAAGWLSALDDSARELAEIQQHGLYLQLGGPVGDRRSFGDQSNALVTRLAARLELAAPAFSWCTDRAPIVRCASALAILAGRLGKISRDIVLCMQSEVGELSEAREPGKGGSSSLPHKHNPVDALTPLAAATSAPQLVAGLLQAMVQEHERAAGAWHAEWLLLPRLCSISHGALQSGVRLLEGLQVDAARMRANLELLTGPSSSEPTGGAAADRAREYLKHRSPEE